MSVLIKGMAMPKNCYDCRLLYDCYSCKVTGKRIDYDRCDNERLADCPLVELPDHGDLIDREALMPKGEGKGLRLMAIGIENIVNAPTVIPAERSEELYERNNS